VKIMSVFRDIRRRDPVALGWAVVLLVVLLAIAIGPLFAQDPAHIDPLVRLQGPSGAHWLGTDEYGRDILGRVLSAGGVSLGLGAVVTGVSVVAGTLIGMYSGFYVRADGVVMRLMDALLAFPPLVLAIALVAFLGSGATSEVAALAIVYTPFLARTIRGTTLALRGRGYITAARCAGLTGTKILWRHVLPNAAPTLLVQASFIYAFALLSDAALSFLGLGVAAPTPTWGNMVDEARPYLMQEPGFIIFPGLAVVIVVMALNYIGDGIRNLVDPRSRAVLDLERLRRRTPVPTDAKEPVRA
jgi:peptide/nickel transport system permease protein